MVESHLNAGNQKLESGKAPAYGISITDACLGWEDSKALMENLAVATAKRRERLAK